MGRGRCLLGLLLVAALALLAGCGGGSGGDETTVTVQTGSLSKAEFITRADAICTAARAEFVKELERFFKEHSATASVSEEEREEGLRELVELHMAPNLEGELAKIGKLGAPKSYTPEVTAFVEAVEKGLDEAREDPIALAETDEAFDPAREIGQRAGMNGCAKTL